jgi:MFS family permease
LTASPRTTLGSRYWKLWTATTISNVGDGVRLAALPLLVTTMTRDPLLVAGTVFASQLPWLLFALVSGALVDRLDQRAVMLAANLFRAYAMILLGLAVLSDFDMTRASIMPVPWRLDPLQPSIQTAGRGG